MKQNDLASALGVSAAMISKLKRRGMPVSSLEAATAWRRQNLDPAMTKTVSPPIEAARLRLMLARAERAEAHVRLESGRSLDAGAVLSARQKQISAFRQKMLAIPNKIAGQFALPGKGRALEEALTAAIYAALAELAGPDDRGNGHDA